MKEIDQEWIERYLADELSEEERAVLESRIAEDPELKEEVEQLKLIQNALQLKRREELLDRFRKRDQTKEKPSSWKILMLLPFIIIGLIWLWYPEKQITPKSNEKKSLIDSISPMENSPVLADSLSEIKNTPESEPKNINPAPSKKTKPSNENSKEQPTKKKIYNPDELYAMNFEPYKDETMNLNLRGNESLSPYDQFIKFYLAGDYSQALTAFNLLNNALKNNDNVLFIKANALMAQGKNEEVRSLLEEIIKTGRTRYLIEARWYLGLCYLKSKELEKAKEQFKLVQKESNKKYRDAADRLLKHLRSK